MASSCCQCSDHFAVDAFVCGHVGWGVIVPVVGAAGFCLLGKGKNKHTAESAGKLPEESAAPRASPRFSRVVTQEIPPMLFVAFFCIGKAEENGPFFPVFALREFPVNRTLSLFVREVPPPPASLLRRGGLRLETGVGSR